MKYISQKCASALSIIYNNTTPMKKKSKRKRRNPYALLAKKRTSVGRMRNKKDKRQNGENKQESYLNEEY